MTAQTSEDDSLTLTGFGYPGGKPDQIAVS
jgi:hypothetical protein